MDRDNKRYLLIIDYFSKLTFLFQISFTTVAALINHLAEPFALKEKPLEIFLDNGQPFNSKEWYTFKDKYGFKQTISGLHYT